MSLADSKNGVKTWLTSILKKENIEILNINILGNSEKGDGYMGDIVFVEINGQTEQGDARQYNLVLKCSKTSQALREKSPLKEAFLNEIYFYDVIFPSFVKFQKSRNIQEPFEKVPKCYGTLSTGHTEIIALENLKKSGFILWDKTKPLTRRHIDMIVQEYGKLHAVSIAMAEQEPENFYGMTNELHEIVRKFSENNKMLSMFEANIEELTNLLKNDLDDEILTKWIALKPNVRQFFERLFDCIDGLKVIIHGDCWNNNFMHHYVNGQLSTLVLLDWQLANYSTPILDISYFLFTCLSEEDMNDMDVILKNYHNSLTDHLRNLGSNPDSLYPLNSFLEEWKRYCKFGILMATMIHRTSLSEKEEIPDMAAAAENGADIAEAFKQPIKNTAAYKNRMKYIVKYAVENSLI